MIATERLLDFVLPPELEAHEPPEARGLRRDEVRLLVSYRTDDRIIHARFLDLPGILRTGDLLVANDSATLPAALPSQRQDGTAVQLHFSTRLRDQMWVVEPRQTKASPGEQLALPAGGSATLQAPYSGSSRLWVAHLDLPAPAIEYLYRWGRPIAYPYVRGAWPIEMYQTVFARLPGSAEMPSAGRAFSQAILDELADRRIEVEMITLHTGVSSLEVPEPPYDEAFSVPARTAAAVQAAKARGGRVIAIGTTVVRALESATNSSGHVAARHGWTNLLVTPERGVSVVDGLITGFHEPRASHLAMLEAVSGRASLERAYKAALEGRYLWHEFGDLHLILP